MFKLLREYRFYVTLAVMILLPIIAMNLEKSNKAELGPIDRSILFITAPVQEVITYTVDRTARFLQNYVYVIKLHQKYSHIVEENRRLTNVIHNYKEMEAENTRLKALLQFQEKIEESKLVAQVIAKDVSTEFKSIRINKGSRAGIEKGMPVVTHEGIVGKVLKVTPEYSDILTILDDLSSVDAIVQRSRAHGIVEGASDSSCLLKHVLRTDDVEVSDTIISSGLDGIYPKGLLIGQVTAVSKKSYGITQSAQVKPSVDFSKLEEVLVIIKQDRLLL